MIQLLKQFFKQRTTITGIAVAILFQLVFSVVWMTGYKEVNDRFDQLRLVIVNEDQEAGAILADTLAQSLPFHTEIAAAAADAESMLIERAAQMVITIPSGFHERLGQPGGGSIPLSFTINESNPSMIKSIMQNVASELTATVDLQATTAGVQAVLKQAGMPEEQARAVSSGVTGRVAKEIHSLYPVERMSDSMVPLMMVLASFVGSMLFSMNLMQSMQGIGTGYSKWSKYFVLLLLSVGTAVTVSAVGTTMVMLLGDTYSSGFGSVWAFQMLFLLAFIVFTQMFVLLFGMAGMLFNIIGLSVQLVTSGALVPTVLLSDTYRQISEYLPATYAVEGVMNLLFGGDGIGSAVRMLIVIMLVSIVVGAAAVALRGFSREAASAERAPV
ncbi:YhgE/Pip domain-containing protein [Paenibacillus sp. J2TS4]|uniref:YhgE/Pip domain-containing protein n=1 Tax=Paenibacillus sp. J2TS4 TaxID=2807194 RepID=UPI001B02876B|nr:ABC transporter permease [Paenibacillus sp. J2TS4]GIP35431.1 hypothetical protein J2TS4_46410 [Paenibacillus sp. J2TS4]